MLIDPAIRVAKNLFVLAILCALAWPQQQQMSTLDRGRALDMLKTVSNEVRKHYYDPRKALKSGAQWSDSELAKYLPGHEIVEILLGVGINATCVQEC